MCRAIILDVAVFLAFALLAGTASMVIGQDANWDLQNYHYYNPWAWWRGRLFLHDIAVAQIQTFHNPLPDLPFYAMIAANWPPRLVALVLVIPTVAAAFFLYKLSQTLFATLPSKQRPIAIACSLAIGTTSAMGIGALSNTMNEWPLAALIVFGIWWIVRDVSQLGKQSLSPRCLIVGGAAMGLAAGAKLPASVFCASMFLAVLARSSGLHDRAREAAWFFAGAMSGFVVSYGFWGYTLWAEFANPLFPYANQWFRSPYWEAASISARTFGPHTLADWLRFPFALYEPPTFFVAEVAYRDPRFPVLWALTIIALGWWVLRGQSRTVLRSVSLEWRLIVVFAVASFLIWTAAFSIYRYLLPLDLLTGILICGLVFKVVRPNFMVATCLMAAVSILALTRIANWGRVDFGDHWFLVKDVPVVESEAIVLITTGEAVAYIVPLLDSNARFLGVLNTLIMPSQDSRLGSTIRNIVQSSTGPFYQLTYPLTEGKEVLAAYGLKRTKVCPIITTNMPVSPLELCKLVRLTNERGNDE